jgi:hypothetical protein
VSAKSTKYRVKVPATLFFDVTLPGSKKCQSMVIREVIKQLSKPVAQGSEVKGISVKLPNGKAYPEIVCNGMIAISIEGVVKS